MEGPYNVCRALHLTTLNVPCLVGESDDDFAEGSFDALGFADMQLRTPKDAPTHPYGGP